MGIHMRTLFAGKNQGISFEDALRETRLARPGRPRRAKSTVTEGGLIRATLYISPNELESLDELCSENGVSRTQFFRAIIRQLKATEIDGADE